MVACDPPFSCDLIMPRFRPVLRARRPPPRHDDVCGGRRACRSGPRTAQRICAAAERPPLRSALLRASSAIDQACALDSPLFDFDCAGWTCRWQTEKRDAPTKKGCAPGQSMKNPRKQDAAEPKTTMARVGGCGCGCGARGVLAPATHRPSAEHPQEANSPLRFAMARSLHAAWHVPQPSHAP